jgi:agmatine/peptidylarginine deiminase
MSIRFRWGMLDGGERMAHCHHRRACLGVLLLAVAATARGETIRASGSALKEAEIEAVERAERLAPRPPAKPPRGVAMRLPAEFEKQRALLVGCHTLVWEEPKLFVEVVAAVESRLDVVAVVRNRAEHRLAVKLLEKRRVPTERVHFVEIPHNTMWVRDYGPLIALRGDGRPVPLDLDYRLHIRPDDDTLPRQFARHLKLRPVAVPLKLDGGNLLSNGQGLCVATETLLYANFDGVRTERSIRGAMRKFFGATEVVFLEPLVGESTGHVDMFVTFTAPDTVVVGAYDPRQDPINAAVLDRNAARLAEVEIAGRPLRVERIPMPDNKDGVWRTFTNVVYANGALLMPSYPESDAQAQARAAALYRRLLPDWKLVPIDASGVAKQGGALHCVTMNLGALGPLPKFPVPVRVEPAAEKMLAAQGEE